MPLPTISFPTLKTELPSNKAQVTYRPMSIRDEKVLLIAKESSDSNDILQAIVTIVGNCIEGKKATELPMCDINWLFLKIRAASVSNIAKLVFTEEVENADPIIHEFDVDLDKVEIKKSKEQKTTFPVDTSVSLTMRHTPVSVYLSKEYLDETSTESQKFDLILTNSIDQISTPEEVIDPKLTSKKELADWISTLPAKTYQDIEKFFSETPKLHYEIKYKDQFGKEQTIVLSTLNDFFTF